MTEGRVLPAVFNFTLPLLMGYLLQQTYSLIDAAIVGRYLGVDALASVGTSGSVVFLILGFCNGCCAGFGIPVAQKFGANDYATLRRLVANSLRLALFMSVGIGLLTSLLCEQILALLRTPDAILHNAYLYLLITFIGVPCTFFYNLLSSIVRALGDSRTPFYVLLLSTVLNIVLDIFCIVVLEWGVAGAAIATVVAQGASAVACFVYMVHHFDVLCISREERRHDSRLIRQLLGIGIPMGLQFSITAIGCIMLQSANNALGTIYVASTAAASRINSFFMCPFESLGMAMATYCGQNFGAGKIDRVRQGVKAGAIIIATYSVIFIAVLWLFAEELTMLFVDRADATLLSLASRYLHTTCCFYPMLGVLCILRYSIQGVGFTNFAMFSGVAELVARGAVALWVVPLIGFTAVCVGDGIAWVCADLFLVPAFIYVFRKIKAES